MAKIDSSLEDYARSLRAAAYGLWSGRLGIGSAGESAFLESVTATVRRGFTRAWYEGAARCGISAEELTPEERQILANEIAIDSIAALNFATFISENSKANGKPFSTIENRLTMWVNRYDAIRSLAAMHACENRKLKWVMGYTKEHCSDCMRLSGRVYRASVWKKYDIYPRKHTLACGGWHCACAFIPTDEPVTPGHPPAIRGY